MAHERRRSRRVAAFEQLTSRILLAGDLAELPSLAEIPDLALNSDIPIEFRFCIGESEQAFSISSSSDPAFGQPDHHVLDLDIADYRGRPLDESAEDNPGAIIRYNNDDDNNNYIEDRRESNFVDDDLVRLTVSRIGNARPQGFFSLQFSFTVRIWFRDDKTVPFGGSTAEVLSGMPIQVRGPFSPIDFWVEGVGLYPGTNITLHFVSTAANDQWGQTQDSVVARVYGVDADIDSDNNNGFNFPENSDWEEYLEANPYGIGKLIYPEATHFTPTRVRLPPGLIAGQSSPFRIVVDYCVDGQSGIVWLWNTNKADPNRTNDDILNGKNRVFGETAYTLQDLGYDPNTGGITIWLDAFLAYSGHSTKKGGTCLPV